MKSTIAFCFFCITVFTTSSCLKKQNLDDEDLGPAINAIEVTKVLGQGFGTYDYNDIKKNEFTSILLSQKIQDSVTQNIEQQGITVENAANLIDKLNLDLIVEDQIYANGQTTQSTRKWPLSIKKATSEAVSAAGDITTQSDAQSPMLTFLMFESLAFGSCFDEGKYPETCHRLQVLDFQFKVPIAAASQHGCADVMSCFIPAKKVEFDIVRKYVTDKDGKPKRTHYTVVLSSKVPFLSRVLQLCSRSIYEITNSNQKILADICYSVNNYAAGQAATP